MKTRVVHTKFWTDGYISSLNRLERIAFLYLITNDQIGLSGVYELPDNKVLFETGLNQVEWEQVKEKFQKDDKFSFYKGWVKIINVDKYQQFSGDKNEVAKERELAMVNKDILDTLSIPYQYSSDTTNNHKSVISNHKSVISNKKEGYSKITDIGEKEILEIAISYGDGSDKFVAFVRSKYDDMVNYCDSKGKTYKNYLAALRDWVKRDALKLRKEVSNTNVKRGVDARNIE